MPSEKSPLRIKQDALMWVAIVGGGVLILALGYLLANYVWEPAGAVLFGSGAIIILMSAPVIASILTELPDKWQLVAVSSLGAIFAVNMGIAYVHFRSVFNDVLFLTLMAMTILAAVVLLGVVDAYSGRLKELISRA